MTMPDERTRALLLAHQLLKDLRDPVKTPDVSDDIRDQAQHVLRHYPQQYEIEAIAEHDARGALVGSMLDATTARDWR